MKKKNLNKDFSYSSYLPNSVLNSEHTSRNSLASTAHSLLHAHSQLKTRRGSLNTTSNRNNSDML